MQSLTYNENTKYYGSYFNGVWKDVLFYDPDAPDIEVEYLFVRGSSSTTVETVTYNVEKDGVYCFLKSGANSKTMETITCNGTELFSNQIYTVARMTAGSQVSFANGQTGNYKWGGGVVYLGTVGATVTHISASLDNTTPKTVTAQATNANTVAIMLASMAPSSTPGAVVNISGTSAGGTLSTKNNSTSQMCQAYRQNPFNGAVTFSATFGAGYHPSSTFVQFDLN